ncbi:hypothetical protein [Azospirillum picis]|uniref:SGNH hydrolase-type esterase domain-containing protein n=1 Tax=Azospirillum picis TaxID=488438 RepID=A0ABU0MQZ8_9PROT|nr:hypothetical protein [Azospirillum picis]MBP2302331.1 hypothetical protein [Azospirillum picis]MDQ0535910.1 hypothetical protein [Azospirillum picis]
MYRLLACIALIVVTVTAMDRVLASALGDLLLQSSDRFMAIYRPAEPDKAPADVVVLGNSRADNHFPVSTLGEVACGQALNLGMGGAPTVLSALLWEDYLERHDAPRLLVLEPTGLVDNPHDLADLPMLGYYSPRIDDFVRQENRELWLANNAFHLLTFNNNQTMRLAAGLMRPADDRTLVGVMPEPLKAQLAAAPDEVMTADDANWRALERIIGAAQARGTKVAVVITPYFPSYIAKLTNFDAFFGDLKARLPKGVTVIDARRAVDKPEMFMDSLHVNADGVRAMFTALEPGLRQLGNCPTDQPAGAIAALSQQRTEPAAGPIVRVSAP